MSERATTVFAVPLPEHDLDRIEARALAAASEAARARSARLLRVQDRLRSLLGALLLQHALRLRDDGSAAAAIALTREGKPYLPDHPEVHFNISHAGRWVVCAVSPHEVGIDVEQCRDNNLAIARRFFQPDEHAALLAQEPHRQQAFFYRLWTAKEAYLKALGTGLQKDLASFTVNIDASNEVGLHDAILPARDWRIVQWQLDAEHPLALCESRRCDPHRTTVLDWADLVNAS